MNSESLERFGRNGRRGPSDKALCDIEEERECLVLEKKKEQTEKIQKPELLEKKNIRLDCSPMARDDVIRAVGQLLCDSGYVDEGYIEAMIKRELSFPTNM